MASCRFAGVLVPLWLLPLVARSCPLLCACGACLVGTHLRLVARFGVLSTFDPPSNEARLPAELKHITKRRRRN